MAGSAVKGGRGLDENNIALGVLRGGMDVRTELISKEPQRRWTTRHRFRLRTSSMILRALGRGIQLRPSGYPSGVSESQEAHGLESAALDERRPDGVSDDTVAAVGKLSEALESLERARGHLYSFHQMMGHTDLLLGDAVDQLREAGHGEVADELDKELVGRNVIEGRWTFQIVEDFDDNYWSAFREHERRTRDKLQGGVRHVFEAEMKERRRTGGRRHHESKP